MLILVGLMKRTGFVCGQIKVLLSEIQPSFLLFPAGFEFLNNLISLFHTYFYVFALRFLLILIFIVILSICSVSSAE